MTVHHISSEEHDVQVKTTMPDSTQAHRQKHVHLIWHTYGEGNSVYRSDRNHNLFIVS